MTPNNLPEVEAFERIYRLVSEYGPNSCGKCGTPDATCDGDCAHAARLAMDAQEVRLALRSRLSSPAPQVWQPMETASKVHGDKMLGIDADGRHHVMFWDRLCGGWDNSYETVEPVGWMPLPTPPVSGVAPREGEA